MSRNGAQTQNLSNSEVQIVFVQAMILLVGRGCLFQMI